MVRLTDGAIDGLDRLRTRHHASLTALVEAIGLHADQIELPREVIELAQRLDRERGSRRPRG